MQPQAENDFVFPADYVNYFDAQGIVRREYLVDLPDTLSQCLRREGTVTTHQLRSFYTHAKRAEGAWRNNRKDVPSLRNAVNRIAMLKAHAHDRLNKGRVSQTFYEFISRNVAALRDDDGGKSLQAFLHHFEALVGFCAGRLTDKERG